ncbi:hypothetical protein BpHYR1_017725 [Brachionus plicatilis]|uniref:Uncharacterized protein n=1 Tax=Brachionus plicatilis TaxID=10195 RepID=A0A3M7S693_BRAPC|nr:hypothetical protein BpHYR1_017725 [Brachionus plicatilis]
MSISFPDSGSKGSCLCEDAEMLRKQREEIILLTKELKNQEDQIGVFQANNKKLKDTIKMLKEDKNKIEIEIQNKNSEITSLKDCMENLKKENEFLKNKISQKDSYIQSQTKKNFSLNDELNKLKLKVGEKEKSSEKLNSEVVKLKSNFKDQLKQSVDLRNQVNDLIKTVESKNDLLKLSSSQIELLENNLRNVYGFISNYIKRSEENTITIELNDKSCNKSLKISPDATGIKQNIGSDEIRDMFNNILGDISNKSEKFLDLFNSVRTNEKQNRTSTPAEFL